MNSIEKVIYTLKILFHTADEDTNDVFGLRKYIPVAISALEKQIPKKVVKAEYDYNCPICGYEYLVNEKYCANCGQRLDWEVEE